MARRNRRVMVGQAQSALDQLKFEVAREIGYDPHALQNASTFGQFLDDYKYRVASELGLKQKVQSIGWDNMSSGECGQIGGRIGGKLGGQMVRRLIEMAEQDLTNR